MVTHTIKNQKKISNKISNSTGNVTIYESPEKSKTDIQIFVNDYSKSIKVKDLEVHIKTN